MQFFFVWTQANLIKLGEGNSACSPLQEAV